MAKNKEAFDALNHAFNEKNYSFILAAAPDFLKKHPDHAPMLNMLAVALAQTGRKNEALAYMKRVVALVPHELVAQMNLARTYMELGDKFSAQEVYLKILDRWPKNVDAYSNYGVLLQSVGKLEEAEAIYRQGLMHDQNFVALQLNLAGCLAAQNRLDEAEALYRTILAQKTNLIAEMELGKVFKSKGFAQDAVLQFRKVIEQAPGNQVATLLLAETLQGLGQTVEAEQLYRQVLSTCPESEIALMKLGNLLRDQKRTQEAESCYLKGRQVAPKNPLFPLNLGELLRSEGRLNEAQVHFEQALVVHPNNLQVQGNLANLFVDMRRLEQAEAAYQRLLQQDPNNWVARSNLFYLLDASVDPEPPRIRSDKIAYGLEIQRRVMGLAFTEWRCTSNHNILRVGLVSGDLRDHPVGHFLEGILVQMDAQSRSRIEFVAYATTTTRDNLTERIAPFFSTWRNITTLDDHAVAGLIHQDGIHVLIDLTGHTAKNRLGLFAYRPAPVQVSWLGYFASTGLHEMDYLLTDPWAIPDGSSQYFSETLWPLPKTRLCFTPPRFDLQVNNLPALQNGYITFGCFNQAVKLTDTVLLTWADMLKAVPNSRLLLGTSKNPIHSPQHPVKFDSSDHHLFCFQ